MQYNKPYDQTNPNAGYVNGNPSTNTAGSIPCAEGLEYPQREIVAVITAGATAGLDAPNNNDRQQLLRTVRSGLLGRFVASGTPDAITITPDPAVAALVEGMRFRLKVPGSQSNTTTTPTLAVNSKTAAILRRDGSAPAKGDLIAGRVSDFEIDAALNARFVGPAPSELAQTVPSLQLVHTGVAATGGSASATNLVVDVAPNIAGYEQGALYSITTALASANGGTVANLDALGARNVKRADGTAIQLGDWGASSQILLADNGSELRLLSSGAAAAVNTINNLFIPGGRPWQRTTPGTYTLSIASGRTFLVRECRGAGAGGGGANSSNAAASGGGGGANAQKVATTTADTVLTIVVGAGGAGGAGGTSPQNGSNGGTTSITVTSGSVVDANGTTIGAGQTLCAATGGAGGYASTGGSGGTPIPAGGIASGGDINDNGDAGGFGFPTSASYIGGLGGLSPGAGGSPQPNYGAAGNTSNSPGVGGNGSSGNFPGGVGSPGRVTMTI